MFIVSIFKDIDYIILIHWSQINILGKVMSDRLSLKMKEKHVEFNLTKKYICNVGNWDYSFLYFKSIGFIQ